MTTVQLIFLISTEKNKIN